MADSTLNQDQMEALNSAASQFAQRLLNGDVDLDQDGKLTDAELEQFFLNLLYGVIGTDSSAFQSSGVQLPVEVNTGVDTALYAFSIFYYIW